MSSKSDSLAPIKKSSSLKTRSFDSLSKISSTVSQKSQSDNGSLEDANPLIGILQFDYSFGYDCKQHFNLLVIDEKVLIYYSGTWIHIFHTDTLKFEFRKSFSKSGIGHIVKNPQEKHIAVGEKCENPLIIVYEWPNFDIISKMNGGATRGYAHLGYRPGKSTVSASVSFIESISNSVDKGEKVVGIFLDLSRAFDSVMHSKFPDGTMLVSQGKEPDHTITIWDWGQAHIILRVKSHGQDVFNAEFSQFVPGQLTSSGLGHIKFWKMAKTFTGLKLQGELGRFGKTEICDIMSTCALPDEKVISSSEWGNLLVWEDRLIKLEVRQKVKGNCHSSAISQVLYNPETQDIISVGMDGWVKLWNRATIDAADPPDEEDWCLEMQPLLEVQVLDGFSAAKLMSLVKKNDDPNDEDWYAQDADGGIWAVSLHTGRGSTHRLLTCHAGSVADMAASPRGHYIASLGSNGSLLIHNVDNRELLLTKRFPAPGTALLWMPIHVEASGSVLVGGFADGVLRVFVANLQEQQRVTQKKSKSSLPGKLEVEFVNIIQRVKSHCAAVTQVCLNPRGSILVSGSEDRTVFVHQILPKREFVQLLPIGFVQLTAPVTYITWRPKLNATAVVACRDGLVTEVSLPERAASFSGSTYKLDLDKETLVFKSVKSELIRAEELAEIEKKKLAKVEKKMVELEKIKADNPNLDIDEELFLLDSDEELEFPPLYYPDTPSPVLFILILSNGNLYLSMDSFDCGYMYQYRFNSTGPVRSDLIPNALNTPVHCFLPICDGKLLVLGMANGVIRVVSCNDSSPDLTSYWDLPMHDPDHGVVCKLCASYDAKYLYSCGTDGNIFTYTLNSDIIGQDSPPLGSTSKQTRRSFDLISGSIPKDVVEDKSGEEEISLEQTKQTAERINQEKLSEQKKETIRYQLTVLRNRFEDLLSMNDSLPESQTLPHSEFELDPRITAALEGKIESDKDLMLRKIAFQVLKSRLLVKKMQNHFVNKIASLDVTVRAIKNEDLRIKAFTHNKLTAEFVTAEADLRLRLEAVSFISSVAVEPTSKTGSVVTMTRASGLESMLKIQTFYHKLTLKGRKMLVKRNIMKAKMDRREQQWLMFLDQKPDIHADDPGDIVEFEKATQTIGDFKLKSSDDYKVPEDKRITPAQKYWQMINLLREVFEQKEAFNRKVCDVRDSKVWLVRRFKQLYHDMDTIQKELDVSSCKERLPVPKCYLMNNFPEHIFRLEFGADPTIYYPVLDPHDEEYDVLLMESCEPVSTDKIEPLLFKWKPRFSLDELTSMGQYDEKDTPWEHELKLVRMIRKLHEQEMIVKEMSERVDKFDENLENLSISRLTYARDIKLMEIFMLTLHQELIVINSYAGQEDEINRKINTCMLLRNDKLKQKVTIQDTIETKIQEMGLWQIKLTEMQEEIAIKLTDNKFATFLNRIYKKKRAIKRGSDDSSSESSSSEDVSEEDFEDDDNEDYIPIKLDENVCPEGCDPRLYEDVINSRNLRYDIEDTIAELRKQVDDLQRELTVCGKELIKQETDVQISTKESEDLQFEKQQKLNDIETVVVLNLSHFCHFVNATHPEDGLVPNPLVFHSTALFTLSGRVRQLERETEQENLKLSQQKMKMQRLNKKKKELKEIRKSLIKDIDDEILRRFGEMIDVEHMEESVLRKILSQARRNYHVDKLREKYDKIISDMKKFLWVHTEDLMAVEKENTRRLKLQIMLEHESMKLDDHLKRQQAYKEKPVSKTELDEFSQDLQQIESILECQEIFNLQLKRDIESLKYKCTPPQERPLLEGGDAVVQFDTSEECEVHSIQEGKDAMNEFEKDSQDEVNIVEIAEERLETIDKILSRLATGSSAHDVAVSIVDEMLLYTGEGVHKSSALECALKLVDELLQFTVGDEEAGDIELVEQFADQLVRLSKSSVGHELS